MKIVKVVRTIKTGVIQKVHDRTGYILNTPAEERKANRKQKRKKIRQSLSQWRPLSFLGRDLKKERKADFGVSNPIPE